MPSPLVRRTRLGREIKQLRTKAKLTSDALATKARMARTELSRLENANDRRPNTNKILSLLEALGIPERSEQWMQILRICRDANDDGWWDKAEFRELSERQQQYADVESGATWIGLYQNSIMPGTLQTPQFIASRDSAHRRQGAEVNPVHGKARLRRQSELLADDGPTIEVLLEEQVIRRLPVERDVMVGQLRHLLDVISSHPRVTIRILPVDCAIPDGLLPRTPMALHTFEDPDDGTALLIEIVTDDLLLFDPKTVGPYVHLFNRMRDVALSPQDSAAFIERSAAAMAAA